MEAFTNVIENGLCYKLHSSLKKEQVSTIKERKSVLIENDGLLEWMMSREIYHLFKYIFRFLILSHDFENQDDIPKCLFLSVKSYPPEYVVRTFQLVHRIIRCDLTEDENERS